MTITYARIEDGAVAELIALPDEVTPGEAFVTEIAATLVDLTGVSPVPETGWSYDGKVFAAPVPDMSGVWSAYKANAQAALDRSDTTLLRCVEAGVTVPADWASYRKALRVVVGTATAPSGWTAETALPTQPAYPSGT